jgi:hypothetical protein
VDTRGDALILSAFTSEGRGDSDLIGPGHTLDAFPTVPLDSFHSSRVYGGHASVSAGSHTFGYQNNDGDGCFDYILILISFTGG